MQTATWQPHRTMQRIEAAHEVDFVDLGPFTCDNVSLSARQHQVVAMFAFGFQSDRIVADYLDIKPKYVQAIVYELKQKYGWRSRLEMGRVYQAMREKFNPEGEAHMKAVTDLPAQNGHAAVTKTEAARPTPQAAPADGIDITKLYPAAAIDAAYAELEKPPISRRCAKVFTPEVIPCGWIG